MSELASNRLNEAVGTAGRARGGDPASTLALRELFWHNVMREMLTSLSVMAMNRSQQPYDPAMEKAMRETFDGRLAIITTFGARIAIAEVHPVFACSVPSSQADRDRSAAVQCTVFQIRTPNGESHTLPLHEIRGFHALTDELMQQIEQMALLHQQGQGPESQEPFGFAAFTSLGRDGGGTGLNGTAGENTSASDRPGLTPDE